MNYLADPKHKWMRWRLFLLGTVFFVALAFLAYKDFLYQVKQTSIGEKDRKQLESWYQQEITVQPLRGPIYDMRGDLLALSEDTVSFWLNPSRLNWADKSVLFVIKEVAQLTGQSAELIEKNIHECVAEQSPSSCSKNRFWLARHLPPAGYRKIQDLIRKYDVKWLNERPEPVRRYPQGASSIIGTVGSVYTDPHEKVVEVVGTSGLELRYQKILDAPKKTIPILKSSAGNLVLPQETNSPASPSGLELHTSFDPMIQNIVETTLQEGIRETRSRSGAAFVMDPYTGGILAMKTIFAGGTRNKMDWGEDFCITGAFQPGSIMKIFSIGAAIENGVVGKNDMCYRKSGFTVNGKHFSDEDARITEDPDLSTEQTLARSSNVCTMKIATKLGSDGKKLDEFYRRMNFGHQTGVDFVGESPGLLPKWAKWHKGQYAFMSYGYGLMVTPLQIGSGLSAYVNDGIWITPHFVQKITDSDGQIVLGPKIEQKRVVSSKTAKTMREMMYAVTQKYGTAQHVKIPGFEFAGKTGTAWVVQGGHYDKNNVAATFAAFFPYKNPRIVIVAVLDRPGLKDHHAAQVTAPIVAKIAAKYAEFYGILPENDKNKQQDAGLLDKPKLPNDNEKCAEIKAYPDLNFCGKSFFAAKKFGSVNKVSLVIKGDVRGIVKKQMLSTKGQVELTFGASF